MFWISGHVTFLFLSLLNSGSFTLFAPTDQTFQTVPADILSEITQDGQKLEQVLKYHVISGFVLAPMLSTGDTKNTLQGSSLTFNITGGVRKYIYLSS